MARFGSAIISTCSDSDVTFNLTYSWEIISQNVETNSSTLKWTLTSDLTDDNNKYPDGLKLMCDGYYDFKLEMGTNKVTIDSPISIQAGTHKITQGTFTQKHADTGYQNFTVKLSNSSIGSGIILTPLQRPDPTFDMIGYATQKPTTFTIDYVVRKAFIVSYPAVITDEDSPVIVYSNPAGNYATSLQIGMSLTTTDTNMAVPYRNISKTGDTYTFEFTAAELLNLYKKLDDRVITTNLRVFIKSVVPVLEGTATETVVDHRDITLNFINYKPTLNVSLKDTSSRSLDVTGDEGIFVNHVSDVYFNLGGKVYKGASIKHLWIQNGDNLITGRQTGYLTEITSDTFYAYIEDSRGYFATYEVTWDRFVDYFLLTCRVAQSLLDANGKVTVALSGKFFEGYFGAVQNSMRMEYLIRIDGSDSQQWSTIEYIDPTVDLLGNYTYEFDITGLDYTNRYELFVRVIDEVMTNTVLASTIVGSIPVFDWSKNDFAFYVPVTINDAEVPSIESQGTSGNWTYRLWSDGTAECWAKVQVTANIANAWGNLYSSGAVYSSNLYFPFEFTEIPVITASLSVMSAAALLMPPGGTDYKTTTKQTGAYELVRPNALSNGTYLINYHVRGRWK